MVLAWHIEALRRQKKLPEIAKLLARRAVKQTPQQMLAMAELLSQSYKGIRIRKATKKMRASWRVQ
jgi:hypothetical protein